MIERVVDPDGIATLHIDDGKANALDLDTLAQLEAALDDCHSDAAIMLVGRDEVFSAGLNRTVLSDAGQDALHELLVAFGRTVLRLWLEPRPVVAAATGHAIAGGAVLALACDHVVAARGEFAWGLSEVTVGLPMPQFGLTLARASIGAHRLDDLILSGDLIGPEAAVDAGFADALETPERVLGAASDHARELARLPLPIYAATKRRLRGAAADVALASLDADVRELLLERGAPTKDR